MRYSNDIQMLCSSLRILGITYFAHVHVTRAGQFTCLGSSPQFMEYYIPNKCYNADVHMAKSKDLGPYLIWDAVEQQGKSADLYEASAQCGVKHTFTIIEQSEHGSDFFHFATDKHDRSINQVYLTHLDLLKRFISYFKEQVASSSVLAAAYDFKLELDTEGEGFKVKSGAWQNVAMKRLQFMENLSSNDQTIMYDYPPLTRRELECLELYARGSSAKLIGVKLNLSNRTIETHLANAKSKLMARNKSELIGRYLVLSAQHKFDPTFRCG